MATKQKPPQRQKRNNIKLAVSSKSKLRHFRLVHHRHTGKLLHRGHTSHLALLGILAVVAPLVFAFQQVMVQALPSPVSQDVFVSAIVPGPPPSVGAVITSPVNGATIQYQPTVKVSGTCAVDTIVVVSSNNSTVGSTTCTVAGIFVLDVQLQLGQNVLTAKNYDTLNQPGPGTSSVTISIILPPGSSQQPAVVTQEDVAAQPVLPQNPYIFPIQDNTKATCDNYGAPHVTAGGAPHVSVVCIVRSVNQNVGSVLGVLAWGGSPPYALDVDWGDGTSEHALVSLASVGYAKVPFKYANAGTYTITVRLKDSKGNAAFVQTSATVYGVKKSFIAGIQDTISHISWFEAPVPLYFTALALTMGFWGGELFDRAFRLTKHYHRPHRSH